MAAECVINVNGMTKELWLSVAVVAASAIAIHVSRTGKLTVPAICCGIYVCQSISETGTLQSVDGCAFVGIHC